VIPVFGRALAASTCVLLVSACKGITSPLEASADSLPKGEIISLGASPPVADATGTRSLATVIALRPRESSTRLVTFVTSAGAFLENGGKQITVRAAPDSLNQNKLIAQTQLRDAVAETAIVRATVGDTYDTVSIVFPGKP
jgi:hypothetical protein